MKNCTTLFLLLFTASLFSQTIKRDTGILNNAAYEILIPENWNKKLVMYAHGYEQVSTPRLSLNKNPFFDVFLEKGFAVALPSPIVSLKDTLCYELRIYSCEKGKLNDLLRRFRNHTLKIFEKHGMTNVGYWTPLDNVDEKLYYVLSYPNRAARDASWKAFGSDTTWHRVQKESELNGKIVSKVESVFLKSTDFSPNNFKNSSNSNVWEFRIYHPTPNNLDILLERFRGFTVKRFEQYGMTNKMYWTTDTDKAEDKKLYYFLTHPSPDAAKTAFDNFRNDPEWIATRKASEVKGGGSLTVKVESIFMYPTDFSKLK